jgi:solute carrier family 25 (mitochondrial adenine nucleotide translocator), member 4/5/6/31
MTQKGHDIRQFAIEFSVSGTAAAVSKSLASPIEVIKIRLQLQAPLIQKGLIKEPYKGIIDCFHRLYLEEGWRAYYKGNLVNVLRYFPTQALNFAFKDYYMRTFNTGSNKDSQSSFFSTVFNNMKAGSLAGASTQLFVYPLDYTRTRLTNDIHMGKLGQIRQFEGVFDCMRKTYHSDGPRGLYRGFLVTCLFMMVYRGMYFGLNAGVKEQMPH